MPQLASAQPTEAMARYVFDIGPQPLADALVQFTDRTGIQFFLNGGLARGLRSPGALGALPPREALAAILKGTGLTYSFRDSETVMIRPVDRTGAIDVPDSADVRLDELSVEAQTPTFGTTGFVATRSTAGMKSNASILETPATVSVITREELDVRGVQDINTAVAYTPNVKASDYPGGQGTPDFTIRGFRSIGLENVYEDGLRAGFNAYNQNIEPYAYERIDIIKGPVSVLYGQGQPGGIVNLVSKRPSFTQSNEVYLQGGNYNRLQGGFDLTGPVVGNEQFAYRFTGLARRSDTQVAFSPDDRIYLAPSVTWRPDADTSLTVLAKYARYNRGGSEQSTPIMGSLNAGPLGRFQRSLFLGVPSFNKEDIESTSIGYILDHTFADNWIFHSAARFVATQSSFNLVGASSGTLVDDRLYGIFPYQRKQSSDAILTDNHIEGRFDLWGVQHNVVAGIDFWQYQDRDRRKFSSDEFFIDLYNPVYPTRISLPTAIDYASDGIYSQVGLYAQDQIKFNGFILTGSIRQDYASATVSDKLSNTTVRVNPDAFTYRAALGYEFAAGIVPYVAYSTSFALNAGNRRDGTILDPSEGKQVEAGVKYQPVGTNSIYTFSAFDITQTNVPTADPSAPGFLVQTGEAVSRGIELEAKTTIAEGLNLVAGYAYLETKITRDNVNPFTGRSNLGNRLPNVPTNALSLFVDYALPLSSTLAGLRVGAGVRYVGETTDITNIDKLPSYALVDASLSYDLARLAPSWKGVTLSVNALNLFDQRYFTSGFYQGTAFEGFRRSVFGTLAYRW
ncbi:TonB-dependent siderophore receptor [Methylobacterium sp. E-045]|uniref:TonB-dependent siderophore receptor n=1 Tax=Methylobacterium sp. E-045 TaxID=2836575 RepID=UPI001FBAB23C|nr:TonB-dependent siderophore receptor [Methylobacterium sp. E-045]MCJ2129268.1 TonB-dependent siderophore receptor [Methylobacterium sp. E-045]